MLTETSSSTGVGPAPRPIAATIAAVFYEERILLVRRANPPDAGKYSHWVGDDLPPDPEAWFKGATELAGSWWPDWHRWVSGLDKTTVPARIPGEGGLPAIEDAPGSFVKVMATD